MIEKIDISPLRYISMLGRQDVIDVFDGERTGVPAVFTNSITVGQMEDCGIMWPEAHFDPKMMSELSLQTHRMFGAPTAHIPFRINVESEAFGCTLSAGTKNSQPAVTVYPFAGDFGPSEIPDDLMSVDDFLSSKCIKDVLQAAEIVRREDVFTVTCMNGPSALVWGMIGMESALIGLMSERDLMDEWMDVMQPYSEAYMHELSQVSDGIMVIDGASTDITPPDYFDDVVGKRLRTLFRKKDVYTILHSCGNTFDVAPKLASLGEDVLSPEASQDMERYVREVDGKTLLAGCINPVTVLMMGTPELVKEKCRESLDAGFDFITPECGIPPMTPNDNIRALFG